MQPSIVDQSGAGPASRPSRLRIALAHDWLCGMRGGERVLEAIARLVAEEHEPAGLYVLFDDGRPHAETIDRVPHTASGLSRLPDHLRRWLLPLYPAGVGQLGRKLARAHAGRSIDLLVSTSSAAIKGMRAPPGVPHLCYCHAPARYLWSRRREYWGGLRGLGLSWSGPALRRWDAATARNVTAFLANSAHTARQIASCYGRGAEVVFPPVRTGFFTPDPGVRREGFWLVVSALEPYKRVDLAMRAAELAGRTVVIAGDGSEQRRLRRGAGPHARFVGRIDDEALRGLYRRAGALLFPQVEDFGIVAAEAQACGCPVAARREGGALDIVVEGSTGSFFEGEDPRALAVAGERAEAMAGAACALNAERFSEGRFADSLRGAIRTCYGIARKTLPETTWPT